MANKFLFVVLLVLLSFILLVSGDEMEEQTNTFFEEGNDKDLTAYKRNRWRSSLNKRIRKKKPIRKTIKTKKQRSNAPKKVKTSNNKNSVSKTSRLLNSAGALVYSTKTIDETVDRVQPKKARRVRRRRVTKKRKQSKRKKSRNSRQYRRLCVKPHYIDVRDAKGNLIKILKRNKYVRVRSVKRLKNVLLAKIGHNKYVEAKYLHNDCNPLPKRTLTKRILRQAMKNLKKYLHLAYHNTKYDKPICRIGTSNRFVFKGKRGPSCYRITPKNGWKLRNTFLKYAREAFQEDGSHPSSFVKFAYDYDTKKFFKAVRQYYLRHFVLRARCERLPTPAFHLCTYFAAKYGPEHAKNYLVDIGMYRKGMNKKQYALALNASNRKDLIRWSTIRAEFANQLKNSFARDKFVLQYVE